MSAPRWLALLDAPLPPREKRTRGRPRKHAPKPPSQWPGNKRLSLDALQPGWTLTRRNEWWVLSAVPPAEREAAYAAPVEGQA
jgi:hypothetical protein